jgi:hypothetical protein
MLIPREHTRDNKPSKRRGVSVDETYVVDEKKHFMRNLCAKASKRTGTPHTLARHIKFGPGGKKMRCIAAWLELIGFIKCVDKEYHYKLTVAGAEYCD